MLDLAERQADVIGHLRTELRRIDAFAQPSGDRSKDIAAMKGLTHRMQEVALGSDMPHYELFFACIHQRQHAIVRSDEQVIGGFDNDRTALAAHTGIDNHDMHRARRKEAIGLGDRPGTIEDVVGSDRVANIDDGGLRMEVQHHSMHDAYEWIVQTEVGSEGDDAALSHASAS